jgi:hypothetical protein
LYECVEWSLNCIWLGSIYRVVTPHVNVRIWSDTWVKILIPALKHREAAKTYYSRNSGPVLVAILIKAWGTFYVIECDILDGLSVRRPNIKGVHSQKPLCIGYYRCGIDSKIKLLASYAIVVWVCRAIKLSTENH